MKLKGSQYYDPAVRAREIANQLQEALWAEHMHGRTVPTGPVILFIGDCPKELAALQDHVFGGKPR